MLREKEKSLEDLSRRPVTKVIGKVIVQKVVIKKFAANTRDTDVIRSF